MGYIDGGFATRIEIGSRRLRGRPDQGRPQRWLGANPLGRPCVHRVDEVHDEFRCDWPDAWRISVPGPRNVGDGLTAARHRLAMALLAAVLVSSGGGCSYVFRERSCVRGERAVRAIEAPDTGRTCVKNGQPPPPGYEEFPPGQRPTYVDQDRRPGADARRSGPRRQLDLGDGHGGLAGLLVTAMLAAIVVLAIHRMLRR